MAATSVPLPLRRLIRRCAKPIFECTEELQHTISALVEISSYVPRQEHKVVSGVLAKFARKNPMYLASALQSVPMEPTVMDHGCRVSILSRSLPRHTADADAMWARIASLTKEGLHHGMWPLEDVKVAVWHTSQWGKYDANFLKVVEHSVMQRLASATQEDLLYLVSMVTAITELKGSPAFATAAGRIIALVDTLQPSSVGHLCWCFNRSHYTNGALAVALQEEADRIAEHGDLYTAVQLFYFLTRHTAEFISVDALQWLAERMIGEELDMDTLLLLCTALGNIPKPLRRELQQEIAETISFLSQEVKTLLTIPVADGGMLGQPSMEVVQTFVSKFLLLEKLVPSSGRKMYPEGYLEAVDACAGFVSHKVEELVADENPPFSLIPNLLHGPTPKSKDTGLAILREAAQQEIHFPTLQSFSYLLLLGDYELKDRTVFRYLRSEFAKTAAGIPLVQLCAALRSLVRGLAMEAGGTDLEQLVEKELEREEMEVFFRYCKEIVRGAFTSGASLRPVLTAVETLYLLGCRDAVFFEDCAAYISAKGTLASPTVHSREMAVTVCLAFGEDALDKYSDVHSFLLEVQSTGVSGEATLRPTEWMNLHDPANALLPLTDEQHEGWSIIERMVQTRSDDTDTLIMLAKEYMKLLSTARPDDLKYFFGVFEEKVLKEDRLLKECLESLIQPGILTKLSGTTIGSILHSLAALRFTYFRTVKQFVLGISPEQWGEMDAAPLVQILSGMSKLSLRIPSVLSQIGRRLSLLERFLGPRDTAEAVHSFQTLGYNDEAVLMQLMRRAATIARNFDEVSMTLLFTTPSVHRLVRSPEVSMPLLEQAIGKITSPPLRRRIALSLRKSSLARELIESVSTRLLPQEATGKETPLRLTQN